MWHKPQAQNLETNDSPKLYLAVVCTDINRTYKNNETVIFVKYFISIYSTQNIPILVYSLQLLLQPVCLRGE